MVYSKKIIHGKRVSWGLYDLLVDGMENQTIADKLFISIQTVRNHIRHIYDKLQVHSKSQAVVKAIREGLV